MFADNMVLENESTDDLHDKLEEFKDVLERNALKIFGSKTGYLTFKFGNKREYVL